MEKVRTLNWRVILRFGLLGGALALYVSAVGMVEAFAQRNLIGTFLTTAHLLLIAGPLGAGLLTAREHSRGPRTIELVSGLLAGLVASLPVLALVLLASLINLRPMFVNVSPGLIEILTLKLGQPLGDVALAGLFTMMGGLGALYTVTPRLWAGSVMSGFVWTLGIGLFSENVSQILQQLVPRSVVRLLIVNQSLRPTVAAVIFLLGLAAYYWRYTRGDAAQTRWETLPARQQRRYRWMAIGAGIVLLLALPWIVGQFLSQVLFMVGLYIMMGLGLNIVVGFAGLLDLGYVAFFAIGAYTMGVLTTTGPLNIGNFNFWTALPVAVLVGVFFGILLGMPVLRMRGDYLAIVTLGFGEIIRILALSDWLAPAIGGAQGVLFIPNPRIGPVELRTPQTLYYLVIIGSLLAAFITLRLRESRLGRQWMAMREDEDVAEAMGINLVQTKLLAFAIGAGFSALSGAIFSSRLGNIFPHSFQLLISINALSLIIVGGMGSIPGVVVGALIMVGMPELLREFSDYRLLMYGILLIVMMLVKPEGFWPEATVKRELHADETEEQQALVSEQETLGVLGEMEA